MITLKRLINRIFHRYTTIRPRYLHNDYVDERELMIHINFELLMRFIESDAIDHIDWYDDNCKLNDEYVIDIWIRLYEWYKIDFMRYYRGEYADAIYANCPDPLSWTTERDGATYFELKFASPDDERKHNECMQQLHDLDERYERMANDNLKLLIDTRLYMWT
jgi:hypothetical protein